MRTVMEVVRAVLDSRITLVAVVTVALFMDEFLMTVVVPILPVVFLAECPDNASSTEVAVASHSSSFAECEKEVNMKLGTLLSSQFVVRLILSFFGTCLGNRLGYQPLMLIGCALMLVSAMVYAFAESYAAYFAARLIHGLAAIPNDVGGLSILAYRFSDNDEKRGAVIGVAIGGFAAGSMVGPPFGGVMYFYFGKQMPFLISAVLLLLLGVVQIPLLERGTTGRLEEDPKAMFRLLVDPYVLITAGALGMASVVFGLLQPSMPVWMIRTMASEEWQLGVVFLPFGLSAIVADVLLGYLAYRIGRWLCVSVALIVMAICTALIPLAQGFTDLILPMTILGLTFGAVDGTCMAVFNYLVEERHQGAYGGAATLSVFAYSFGFVVGPSLSAFLLSYTGFNWMLWGLAIVVAIYSPFCLLLRNTDRAPSTDAKGEEMTLILPDHKPQTIPFQQQCDFHSN